MTCFFVTLLVIILVPVVGIPVLLRSKITLRAEPVVTPLEPDDLPEDVVRHFSKAAQPLATNEFDPIMYFSVADNPPGPFSFVAFWTNPKTLDVATVVVSVGGGTIPLMKQSTVVHADFYALFDNGFRLVTSNNPEPPWTKPVAGQHVVQVMGVESPAVVFRLHQNRTMRLKPPGAAKVLPPAGEEMKWFREMLTEQLKRQTAAGYFEPTGQVGTYRLSWLGAFKMGMGMLPPIKQIRRWPVRERGEAELKLARGSAKVM